MTKQTDKEAVRAKKRARKRFRETAERANPSPFLTMLDARGRPRHAARHTSVKA